MPLETLLKIVDGYVRKATPPCAFAYASARIRRLVRLAGGSYCLAVAEKQRSGLAIRLHTDATMPTLDCSLIFAIGVMVAVRGRPSGLPGVSVTRIANLRTAATFTPAKP